MKKTKTMPAWLGDDGYFEITPGVDDPEKFTQKELSRYFSENMRLGTKELKCDKAGKTCLDRTPEADILHLRENGMVFTKFFLPEENGRTRVSEGFASSKFHAKEPDAKAKEIAGRRNVSILFKIRKDGSVLMGAFGADADVDAFGEEYGRASGQ